MRPETKSLREVTYPKPLRECGIEELAVHQMTATPSGGVMFARKQAHVEKDQARRMILDLLTPRHFPKGLAVLSMPGLEWKFELGLLGLREGNWRSRAQPHRTYLTCIENDRSIFHAALMQMPGLHHEKSAVHVLPPTPFAERAVRNRWIGRFFFGNVDGMMQLNGAHSFDAAWLDYTGPMTVERLAIIQRFFTNNIRSVLAVTSLKARWNRAADAAVNKAGGYSTWIVKALGGRLLHELEYQDGVSPMAQICVRK